MKPLPWVGLLLVVGPAGQADESRLLGDALFVAGAALWGVYSVLARRASARFNAVSTTLYGTALGTLILLPLAVTEDGAAAFATSVGGRIPPHGCSGSAESRRRTWPGCWRRHVRCSSAGTMTRWPHRCAGRLPNRVC